MRVATLANRPQKMLATIAALPAASEGVLMHAERSSPIGQYAALSGVLDPHVVAPVAALLRRCRPHHVSRLVVAVVVYAFHGVSPAGSRPQICHVVDKALRPLPALANHDTPPAVAFVGVRAGPMAPADHAVPAVPVGGARLPVKHAQATAGADAFQVDGADHRFVAALASAKPLRMPVRVVRGARHQGETADDLAGAIFECSHARYPTIGCGRRSQKGIGCARSS